MRPDLFEPNRYLYHYTKWEKAARFIIPDRRLRLSPFTVMNDPMEFIDPTIGAGFGYAPGDHEANERFSLDPPFCPGVPVE